MLGDAYLKPAPSDEEIIDRYRRMFDEIAEATGLPVHSRDLLDIIERRTGERDLWRHRAHHVLDLWLEYNPDMMPQEVKALLQEKQDYENQVFALLEMHSEGVDILGEIPGESLELMMTNASDPDREALQSWAQKLFDWAESVKKGDSPDAETVSGIA